MKRACSCALVLAWSCLAARADTLHLTGGGTIEADRWWIEGETLRVESDGGVVGLPRAMLLSVDRGAAKPEAQKALPAAPKAARAREEEAPGVASRLGDANAALMARDYGRAALGFHEVVDAAPELSDARVGYAIAEMALGRDAMALPVILDGLMRHPEAAELHEILGVLRDREERVDDALASWRQAFRLQPSDRVRERIVKAERELAAGRAYAYSAAAHFTVRYDGALDQDLVATLTDFLEDRFSDLTRAYRHAPSQPITVLLYARQAFRDVTQAGSEVAGLFDGKIRVPMGGLKSFDRDAERVLTHELTHAIVQSKSRGNCPRWLHEGLAQIAEGRPLRRADAAALAATVRADAPATWPDAAFTYPAALSLTRFLEARRDFDLLVSLLARLGDGEGFDDALRALYGGSYDELAAAWAASLTAGSVR